MYYMVQWLVEQKIAELYFKKHKIYNKEEYGKHRNEILKDIEDAEK